MLTIVVSPALACLTIMLLGRRLGSRGSSGLVILSLLISLLVSGLYSYDAIIAGSATTLCLGSWLDGYVITSGWLITITSVSGSISFVVLAVALLVHLFAIEYMLNEPQRARFLSLLVGFTAGMTLLLVGGTVAVLFVGYEIIGLLSFILVGYWSSRSSAGLSAVKAFCFNRVGDLAVTLSLVTLACACSSYSYSLLYSLSGPTGMPYTVLTIASLLAAIGTMGKSAQFGLHTWLPDSMEGPTPVSALLHAATLVAAGVYLLIVYSPLYQALPIVRLSLIILGSVSALVAATTALLQHDAKRLIAYSTASQYGYMTACCGLGDVSLSALHLSNHAAFKALLFVSAGAVLHATADEQDQRRAGGYTIAMPITYVCSLIASLSLLALPYLAGSTSKELILETAAGRYASGHSYLYLIGTLVALLTAAYSTRLLILFFLGPIGTSRTTSEHVHEASALTNTASVLLAILAVVSGYFLQPIFTTLGVSVTSGYIVSSSSTIVAELGLPTLTRSLPLLATLLGIAIGIYGSLYIFMLPVEQNVTKTTIRSFLQRYIIRLTRALSNRYYNDNMYSKYVIWPTLNLAYWLAKTVDHGLLERIGPNGIRNLLLGSTPGSLAVSLTNPINESSLDDGLRTRQAQSGIAASTSGLLLLMFGSFGLVLLLF